MDGARSIFEHRTHPLPRGQQGGGASTPKKQPATPSSGGYLSPNSTTLVKTDLLSDTAIVDHGGSGEALSPSRVVADLYCKACKKKFGSEATFGAHLGSEKHRRAAAAAAQGRAAIRGAAAPHQHGEDLSASPTKQRGCGARVRGRPSATAPDEALASMGKALKVSERDPAVAAVVLWSVAKELAQHTQHCDSLLRALEGTQKCLRALEADPGLRSAKGSQAAWTARSLVKTALECDLALARLLSASAKERSASEYTAALCRYLGIEQGALDEIGRLRDPLAMSGRAAQVAAAIPRKFAKPEDVAQAVEAMEEVASAQLAFSASAADNQLAQRGLATHFLRYSFALEKELPDAAFQALLAAASAFRWLGHDYFGNECAMLIIARHMDQPAARTHVATAIVASLRASDPVRARVLLENYNSACTDPWSQFLAEFTARSSNADVAWLSSDAWREWDNVLLRSPDEDRHILELVEALLTLLLEHYSWYASSSPASHHG